MLFSVSHLSHPDFHRLQEGYRNWFVVLAQVVFICDDRSIAWVLQIVKTRTEPSFALMGFLQKEQVTLVLLSQSTFEGISIWDLLEKRSISSWNPKIAFHCSVFKWAGNNSSRRVPATEINDTRVNNVTIYMLRVILGKRYGPLWESEIEGYDLRGGSIPDMITKLVGIKPDSSANNHELKQKFNVSSAVFFSSETDCDSSPPPICFWASIEEAVGPSI